MLFLGYREQSKIYTRMLDWSRPLFREISKRHEIENSLERETMHNIRLCLEDIESLPSLLLKNMQSKLMKSMKLIRFLEISDDRI